MYNDLTTDESRFIYGWQFMMSLSVVKVAYGFLFFQCIIGASHMKWSQSTIIEKQRDDAAFPDIFIE